MLTSPTVHSRLLVPVRATTSPRRQALPSEKETDSPFRPEEDVIKAMGRWLLTCYQAGLH